MGGEEVLSIPAGELDTAKLADRIIAAAERGDAEEMEELSAAARRKVGSGAPYSPI